MTLIGEHELLPLERPNRVSVLAGPFGSGKTEIAINRAFAAGALGKAGIADLDIVNPYFRSRELRETFESKGIAVHAPRGALAQADLPALTGDLSRALAAGEGRLVLDVGGDPAGARLLGTYRTALQEAGAALFLVVNPYRPFVSTPEEIVESMKAIEAAAGLAATGLISNPNLIEETTPRIVADGHAVVREGAKRLGLPIAALFFMPEILGEWTPAEEETPLVPLSRFMLPPWHSDLRRFAPYRDRRSLMEPPPPTDGRLDS